MSTKTFQHNGGTYTRPDIPFPTSQFWTCHVCQKQIDSQEEHYQLQQGFNFVDKVRFIPASRYWHGYTVGIEFCSADCSFVHYEKERNEST